MSRVLPSTFLIGLCPAKPAYGPLIPDSLPCEPQQGLGDGVTAAVPQGLADGDAWRLAVAGEGDCSDALVAAHGDCGWPPWRVRTSDELARPLAMAWPDEAPECGEAESEVVLVADEPTRALGFSSTKLAVRFICERELTALHAYASDPWPGPTSASARPPNSEPWSTAEDTSRARVAEPAEAKPVEDPDPSQPDQDQAPYIFGDVVLGAWGRK